MTSLTRVIAQELAQPTPAAVTAFAESLADGTRDAAVLYYGSTLRTGDLAGMLDFYRLTRLSHQSGLRGLVERALWPDVSYHEFGGLRAKVATLPMAVFLRAAEGRTLDTTIWARFVQPARLVWSADPAAERQTAEAVAAAVRTASRFAAALGPAEGTARAYWLSLFRRTYAAEFRVESAGRADALVDPHGDRYADLLPIAWREAGVVFHCAGGVFRPAKRGLPGWRLRGGMGKPLNLARLVKAAFTFEGGARYAAWKIERHTGLVIEVTPWRERHPILAAPGVLWRLWRRSGAANDSR